VAVDDPTDPRLADYRDLRDPAGRHRYETDQGVFMVEGRVAVRRLVQSPYPVASLLVDYHQATTAVD
jgi:tRNA G18 (ribose-2'-O)-methylase SpoU